MQGRVNQGTPPPAFGCYAAGCLAFGDERRQSGANLMARPGALPEGAIANFGCGAAVRDAVFGHHSTVTPMQDAA